MNRTRLLFGLSVFRHISSNLLSILLENNTVTFLDNFSSIIFYSPISYFLGRPILDLVCVSDEFWMICFFIDPDILWISQIKDTSRIVILPTTDIISWTTSSWFSPTEWQIILWPFDIIEYSIRYRFITGIYKDQMKSFFVRCGKSR